MGETSRLAGSEQGPALGRPDVETMPPQRDSGLLMRLQLLCYLSQDMAMWMRMKGRRGGSRGWMVLWKGVLSGRELGDAHQGASCAVTPVDWGGDGVAGPERPGAARGFIQMASVTPGPLETVLELWSTPSQRPWCGPWHDLSLKTWAPAVCPWESPEGWQQATATGHSFHVGPSVRNTAYLQECCPFRSPWSSHGAAQEQSVRTTLPHRTNFLSELSKVCKSLHCSNFPGEMRSRRMHGRVQRFDSPHTQCLNVLSGHMTRWMGPGFKIQGQTLLYYVKKETFHSSLWDQLNMQSHGNKEIMQIRFVKNQGYFKFLWH